MNFRLITFLIFLLFFILAVREKHTNTMCLYISLAFLLAFEVLSFMFDWILGTIFIITVASSAYFIWYTERNKNISTAVTVSMFSSLLLFSFATVLQIIEIFIKIF